MRRTRSSPAALAVAALMWCAAACSGDAGPSSTPATTTAVAGASSSSVSPSSAPPTVSSGTVAGNSFVLQSYPVPDGSAPHDVSPARDGKMWFTAQRSGRLGLLDPATGESRMFDLGAGAHPHGVITGPDGAAWVTDGGRNAIIRVDQSSFAVREFPLPAEAANANLNTAVFDHDGVLWFTGQAGWYGRLDPSGAVQVFRAPKGAGPYGITVTPSGDVYYASLAGSYVGRIDRASGRADVLEPPVVNQGSRRVWSDSKGRVWVSAWNSGDLMRFDPSSAEWQVWRLPGSEPQPYAVYVDETDAVWLSEFNANALVRFDPATEQFVSLPLPRANAQVRQLLGRPGEVWGAESGTDHLVVVRRAT